MNGLQRTIQYEDTSIRKYPYNKYYDYKDLKHVSKRVFQERSRSQTIDAIGLKARSKNSKGKTQSKVQSKKSMNTSKTINSSRAKNKSSKSTKAHLSITIDNYKDYSKNQIAQQLHQYMRLSLQLRRQNETLKAQVQQSKRNNKQNLVDLQKKINKINEKHLQLRQKQLNTIQDSRSLKGKKQRPGQFKRFFLHFMDSFAKIDEKLHKKIACQKSMEHKLALGQKVLKESSQYLKDKKYKFNCIYA